MSRSVVCVGPNRNEVPMSNCYGAIPEQEQTCNEQPCGTYSYRAAAWSECTSLCAGGRRERKVECIANNQGGIVVDNFYCTGLEPPSSEACNTQACGAGEYAFKAGPYGSCDAECGGGNRTRDVSCFKVNTGYAYPFSYCKGQDIPVMTQPCNPQRCANLAYRTDPWGDCDSDCGGGIRRRKASCYDTISGNAYPLADCHATRPCTPAEVAIGGPSMVCRKAVRPTTEEVCNKQDCSQCNGDAFTKELDALIMAEAQSCAALGPLAGELRTTLFGAKIFDQSEETFCSTAKPCADGLAKLVAKYPNCKTFQTCSMVFSAELAKAADVFAVLAGQAQFYNDVVAADIMCTATDEAPAATARAT
jgi:hypothetical protein